MAARNQFLQIRVTGNEKKLIARAAARAGVDMSRWVLDRALPSGALRFHELLDALSREEENRSYLLAELNDLLSGLTGAELAKAVAEAPAAKLDPYFINYVAAMIETAAETKGVQPPGWTARVAGLSEPRFGSSLKSLRLHLLVSSPPAFRRRNIFIDASIGDRV